MLCHTTRLYAERTDDPNPDGEPWLPGRGRWETGDRISASLVYASMVPDKRGGDHIPLYSLSLGGLVLSPEHKCAAYVPYTDPPNSLKTRLSSLLRVWPRTRRCHAYINAGGLVVQNAQACCCCYAAAALSFEVERATCACVLDVCARGAAAISAATPATWAAWLACATRAVPHAPPRAQSLLAAPAACRAAPRGSTSRRGATLRSSSIGPFTARTHQPAWRTACGSGTTWPARTRFTSTRCGMTANFVSAACRPMLSAVPALLLVSLSG